MSDQDSAIRIGFGLYEADLLTGELWKAGRKIKLQGQPFKLLTALVQSPGVVVTREELQVRLWGKDAVGDFDHSLGTAVNKIREALGDTADNPRFVETLARRGYRWIAPVQVLERRAAGVDVAPEIEVVPEPVVPEPVTTVVAQRGWGVGLGVLGGIFLALMAWAFWAWWTPAAAPLRRIEQVTRTGRIDTGTIVPGMLALENLPAGVTDGSRLYIPVLAGGRSVLEEVNLRTGTQQQISVPSEIASPTLGDLSPDGSTLLLRSHLSPESELPFWVMPTSGGSALKLADVVGHDATWMPDGKAVLVASGNQLLVKPLGDGSTSVLATLPERAFWLRWSPDGKLLRFTLLDPLAHTMRLGELQSDGKHFKILLEHWSEPSSECCGVWTGEGSSFVFQSMHGNVGGNIDLWRLRGKRISAPERVTDGPMSYVAPIASRTNDHVYFLGLETQSALKQFNKTRNDYTTEPPFLADAARVEYSRDHAWVTWTDQSGRQWRAHADGSETIRLTPDSMQVFLGRWSPDGRRVALMAREPGKAWRIYLVGAEGGAPEALLNENRNEADPSWSPDGQKIVFGRVSDVMGKEEGQRDLEFLDVRTRTVTTVPGSAGLFSPRWSPDGRYIAALSLDQRRLVLFDSVTVSWQTLAETTAADPVWSSDGKSIFFHAALAEAQPIYRLKLGEKVPERVVTLSNSVEGTTTDSFFCGLTPEDAPIVRIRTATGNLYAIALDDHPEHR